MPAIKTMTLKHNQTALFEEQEIQIRRMTQDDIESVVAIEQSSFPDPWSYTLFYQQLKVDWGLNYVAVRECIGHEIICGYVCGMIVLQESTLHKIACDPAYRRQGIGGSLVQHFIRQAFSHGATSFFLDVRASNKAAQELYKKHGFMQTSVRRRYYSESGEDALIMELHFGSVCKK